MKFGELTSVYVLIICLIHELILKVVNSNRFQDFVTHVGKWQIQCFKLDFQAHMLHYYSQSGCSQLVCLENDFDKISK